MARRQDEEVARQRKEDERRDRQAEDARRQHEDALRAQRDTGESETDEQDRVDEEIRAEGTGDEADESAAQAGEDVDTRREITRVFGLDGRLMEGVEVGRSVKVSSASSDGFPIANYVVRSARTARRRISCARARLAMPAGRAGRENKNASSRPTARRPRARLPRRRSRRRKNRGRRRRERVGRRRRHQQRPSERPSVVARLRLKARRRRGPGERRVPGRVGAGGVRRAIAACAWRLRPRRSRRRLR